MAILLSDSFDHYTTIAQKWDSVNGSCSIGGSYGRLGTSGLKINNGSDGIHFAFPAAKTTVIVGQAVYFQDVTNTHIILTLLDGSGEDEIQLQIKQEGANFKIYRNTSLLDTVAHGMSATIWYYVEVKATIGDSGSVTIRVDNSEIYDQTLDTDYTGSGECVAVELGGEGGGTASYTYRDDVLIMDTSGSYCNDFKGDVIIQCIMPSGAGGSADWTPSAGSNYQCVDETPPSTGDYIESATLNATDTYATGDLSPLTGDVYAVVVNHYSQKTGTAARGVSGVCSDLGTSTFGNENTLDAAYKMRQSIMYQNQRTSAPFTISDVNEAQFGVKLTT